MKHLLKLGGMTPEEILHILDVADEYKRLHKGGVDPKDLQGKAVALVFAKNSTRTRTSLEVGIYQMGGLGTYLSAGDLQTARGEPVQDTARVLGRYYDAIVCRTYKQTTLDMLAKYSGIPVVSGMTDYAHPLQVLTDLMTVRERKGTLAGLKAGFVGDGYNMANSVIVGCLAVGMTVTIACPKGYRPAADVLMLAKQYGDKFTLTNDPDEAARDADVLFTDVWVSMGMEREAEQRRRDFTGFTLDAARMALAKPDCMVQHPLPAHRGEEIAPDVLEAHADEIFDEAENRIYVEKAVLAVLPAGERERANLPFFCGGNGETGGCRSPLDAMWYTVYITVRRCTMPKQTLQQKIRHALGRFTAKRIAMILLGTAILSFGIHNIHQRTAITEGGIIGLVLLINHWLGVPASVASPLLDAASYALAFKFLGWDFLLSAGVASVSLAGFYRIWECLPPMLPDLTPWPLAAALLGGVFVGVGVGLIVRQGGSSGGDDALALVIHKLTGWRLSRAYLFTDLTVLFASLSYIPFRRIAFSLVTVTVSSLLIDFIKEWQPKTNV